MGGRRKAKGSSMSDEVMSNTKNLYPVSDQDINRLKASMDNSQKTTKTKPDGMGKDSTAAIKEFLGKLKE